MKILITTGIYPPEIGGPATYTKLLEENFRKIGIDVGVLPFRVVIFLPKVIRHLVFVIHVLLKSVNTNIIYAQDPVSVGLPSLIASKIMRKKFIIRVAGDYAWEQSRQRYKVTDSIDNFQDKNYGFRVEFMRSIQKFVVRRADKIITPSLYFSNLVSKWMSNRKIKIETVYNGIDFKELPRADSGYQYKPKTIISAGRLVPWKGFEMLIGSLVELQDWKLFIAGEGPEELNLKKTAENLEVKDRVIFLGKLEREHLAKFIKNCEIFALNTHFESFSFQVVESMYVGTPVISTLTGSIPEIIESMKSGILITPDDKLEFIKSVEKLSSDFGFREKITAEAEKRSRDFSIENTVGKTLNIIENILVNK